ncbi:hypothetical protein [Pelagovum pacificum]|nr:hypothetical protein [Pelagovum pacificum]QQA44202.1 hypothetical protein I8N54_06380 [Pelagovum pacificum]
MIADHAMAVLGHVGLAGFAALWAVKVAAGWAVLRMWRLRRARALAKKVV